MKGKIFNAQEVQAIIAGNKTMFREVIKEQPPHDFKTTEKATEQNNGTFCIAGENYDFWFGKCPYQIGQKIFVKESFADFRNNNSDIFYKSDFDLNNLVKTVDLKWKPAQHMKQEHSRITLEITDVKIKRLTDISEEDCKKEGIGYTGGWNGVDYYEDDGEFYFGKLTESEDENEMFEYPDLAFSSLWNKTHKKPKEKFEANPWVWVVDFKVNK